MTALSYDVVIPTLGRPSLAHALRSLADATGPPPDRVFVVDDRRERVGPLAIPEDLGDLRERIRLIRGDALGPAAARNRGWMRSRSTWIAFLDDDVRVTPTWRDDLAADLLDVAPGVAASQGRIRVPLSPDRRPTDWERNVRGLEDARFATADCAYRRDVLARVGGFDERFPRAFREDADLALRVLDAGYEIVLGEREIEHPVRPADPWISVRLQRGNEDDALMRAVHGSHWYARAFAPVGRFRSHAVTVTCAALAAAGASLWLARTLSFAWARIAPGPRTSREIATMLATSAVIPFAAVRARARGAWRHAGAWTKDPHRPELVLFDRDGTLVGDVPGARRASELRELPGAREALARLRAAGVKLGVVTNQPGIATGSIAPDELDALHADLEARLGPLEWFVCEHAGDAGCACRKPAPGLVLEAARKHGVDPAKCVVVGDIGSDVDAALAAGARAILIPTRETLLAEIEAAPALATDLGGAVDMILGGAV